MTSHNNIKSFFEFVKERHAIWVRRDNGEPAPWTEDPILQKYKFCNVYRELDRGTEWVVCNARSPHRESPEIWRQDIIFQVIQYRLLNNPHFFEIYGLADLHGYATANDQLEDALIEYKQEYGYIFNTAYTCFKTFNNSTGIKNTIKSYCFIVDWAFENIELITKAVVEQESAEESCKALQSIPGVGPFLAYEIWCDFILLGVVEWTENDYVNVGPGAVLGLEIIFPELNKHGFTNAEWGRLLRQIWSAQSHHLPPGMPPMSLRSVEHSLCEYRKYVNLQKGLGRPRLFKPFNQTKK